MTRIVLTLLAIGILAANPAAASVRISVLGLSSSAGTDPVAIGDTVTIDLRLRNDRVGGEIVGIGLWARGYDESVVDFVSGEASTSFFNSVLVPGFPPLNGLPNFASSRSSLPSPQLGERRPRRGDSAIVEFAAGISLVPVTGDGSLDIGVGGVPISAGGAHARLTFQITGPGITEVLFVGDAPEPFGAAGVVLRAPDSGSSIEAPIGTSVSLFAGMVVPEPTTAILLGLGLAGLSSAGRGGRGRATDSL